MGLAFSRAALDGPNSGAVGVRTGALFTAHGRMVFSVCRAILLDADEAEDATQATFLSAHEALLGGATIRDAGAWLATIARNECRSRLRSRGSEALPLREEWVTSSRATDDDVERRTTVEHLRGAIATLPEKQREAVVLRDLYGLHYVEIGLALGVSRPSVEALLFRARRTLRARLRSVAGSALAVPGAVREGLAQAVPWLGPSPAGTLGASGAGVGIAAKVAWPVAVKLAAGAIAVGVTGNALVGSPPATGAGTRASAPSAQATPATRNAAIGPVVADLPVAVRPSPILVGDPIGSPLPARARVGSPGPERRPGADRGASEARATPPPARRREPAGTDLTPSPTGTRVKPAPAPSRAAAVTAEPAPTRVESSITAPTEAEASPEAPREPATTDVVRTGAAAPDAPPAAPSASRGQ